VRAEGIRDAPPRDVLLIQVFLLIVPTVAVTIVTRSLLRRHLPPVVMSHAEKVVPFVLGSFGGFYGLVAGFMLSNSWVELRGLRSAMTAEVNALADMGDIAANLPEPRASQLERAIDDYLRTVVDHELPMMAQGRTSPATTRALTELWGPLGRYQPQSDWEVSVRAIAINKVMAIGEQRRQRIVFSRERLPSILWWVLISSALVVIASSCIVSLNYRQPAGFSIGAVTGIVVLVLFSIHVLDRPFQYGLAPESSDYVALWHALGGPETFANAPPTDSTAARAR
jgi:hypothetical protein